MEGRSRGRGRGQGRGRRAAASQEQCIWRVGNVVDLRKLKSDPGAGKTSLQLSQCDVEVFNPIEVDLDDPKAVLAVGWYHECNKEGEVQVGQYKCNKTDLLYYLPADAEEFAEPIVMVSNNCVIERLDMAKEPGHRGVWRADKDHKGCIVGEFKKRVPPGVATCYSK